MSKFIVPIFIFSLFFSGCVVSLNKNKETQKRKTYKKIKLDKDALYIKRNYLLLGKIDINSSFSKREEIVLNYIKNLIYTAYSKKFFVKQEVSNSRGILTFVLTLKDPFWKIKKEYLIKEKCSGYLKDLQRLKNYIKHPTGIGSAIIEGEIEGINKACYDNRIGGGSHCKIIHNIKELYEHYERKYKKCINENRYNNTLRQTKIWIKLTHMRMRNKKGHVIIINLAKKRLFDNKLITEKYIVLDIANDKKLYILSLDKKRKFSKIFDKKLRFLSSDDLLKIKDAF